MYGYPEHAGVEARTAVVDTTPAEAEGWPLCAYEAAGGVVIAGGKVLVLRRGSEVRLPKARIEDRERPEECAVREVREESGLRSPRIVRLLGTVNSRFAHDGRRYERAETWFLMELEGGSAQMNSPESQFEPIWLPLDEAEAALTLEQERVPLRWARAVTPVPGDPGADKPRL